MVSPFIFDIKKEISDGHSPSTGRYNDSLVIIPKVRIFSYEKSIHGVYTHFFLTV